MSDVTFSDAIEQIMIHNGFYAPLSLIYKEFSKYREKTWLTPDKTIQEKVQRDKRFTRIWLWVYALTEHLQYLPKEIEIKSGEDKIKRMHTHIQWMLIEIGNIEWFETYTPDKNWVFINRELGKIASLNNLPAFTYENILNESVRFIDVVWLNERWFPARLFEVENSTDFRAWFIKFNEIQDFRTEFIFVAPEDRKIKFETEKNKSAFKNISDRCWFLNYDYVQKWYQHKLESKLYK